MNKSRKWNKKYRIEVSGYSRGNGTEPTFAEELFDTNMNAILRNYRAMFKRTKITINGEELK